MEIRIEPVAHFKKKDLSNLKFGTQFTDRMFIMEFDASKGWHSPRIEEFHNFSLSPATMVFHYAQEVFEGAKGFYQTDGKIGLFRLMDNLTRMNDSAERMCMPRFDNDIVHKAILELVDMEREWIPHDRGTSLYIRPVMIGTDPVIKVKKSDSYLFYVILSPVGAYFSSGFQCTKILVEDRYVRAVKGGIGTAKTGGNYAASIKAGAEAAAKGYEQVLWLDGISREKIQEVGSMNIFFVINDTLITPMLDGSILPGITRDSVIKLAKKLKLKVEERDITMHEVVEDLQSGALTEVFGSGTACVISPVGELNYHGKNFIIGDNKVGKFANLFYKELTAIQYGESKDEFGWLTKI